MERFKHTERTTTIFNNIISDYRSIDSDSRLAELGLEYEDYNSNDFGFLLDCLRYDGEGETDSKNIALWLSKYGCNVYMVANTWKIEL